MPRILHLGFGNFHRAHQAFYTQRANDLHGAQDGALWKITAVSMSRRDLKDALAPQSFAYSLGLRGPDGTSIEAMNVHEDILVAKDDPQAVIDQIADQDVQIVTLTITEKGYGLGTDGRLDLDSPAIQSDLRAGTSQTAIALLARGLAKRAATKAPMTVISCDNLSDNGALLKLAVAEFATAAELDISGYLQASVTFPSTMVDRITPATTDAARDEIAALTGVSEPEPVITEVFSEWVIEDDFATQRPAWDQVGVVISTEVAPYEARKLRLLNASHSLLAYGGLLRGHTYVHEAISDPILRQKVDALWGEAIATLPADIQPSCQSYCEALIERFKVPEIRHELRQIAMDGSLKVPVRLISAAEDRQEPGLSSPALMEAVAAWFAHALRGGIVSDPKADLIAELVAQQGDDAPIALIDQLGWASGWPFDAADLTAGIAAWCETSAV
ncbi:MAG: mannitol dehydrogenase family protein [Cognatishimia sp.]|uniref:mannitol dehydrogenase family protein n=1 Tax=Cognatishimia sp. TaxID=2211648 RepID=UPI003B8DABA3